jgi:glucose-1-phosphate adenylyltransferase
MKKTKLCAILKNPANSEALLPLTENRPLDTLPFDCKYRLIDFPLSAIANAQINSVFMVFNEGETRSVFDHIGGGKEWNLDSLQNRYFVYFYQEFFKQKAAGQPYFASIIEYLEKSESEYTVIMGSNMLCNINLQDVLAAHEEQDDKMTVVYKKFPQTKIAPENNVLEIDSNGEITKVEPFKPNVSPEELLNLSMGIYIIETDWLIEQFTIGQENNEPINISEFLLKRMLENKTNTYEYTDYLSNIYDINSYYQANLDMLEIHNFVDLMYNEKIYTKLKNEVPTFYSTASTLINSQCATGCVIEGRLENSLVSRRSVIKAGAEILQTIIMSNATIEEHASISYAILDKNVTVKAGVTIKGTPEKPVIIRKNEVVTTDVIGG